MKNLPHELWLIVQSYLGSYKDFQSCALVSKEWYSNFASAAISEPGSWFIDEDGLLKEEYTPFMSEAQEIDCASKLINKFQPSKVQWYNENYTPYITELNLQRLNIDLTASGLKFAAVKTIVGYTDQLLPLFASNVVQSKYLQNLKVNARFHVVHGELLSQLFESLVEFNIERLEIVRECQDMMVHMDLTSSIKKFLGQLTRLETSGICFEREVFVHLENLEVFSMKDTEGYYAPWGAQAIGMMDSVTEFLDLAQIDMKGNRDFDDLALESEKLFLEYLSDCEKGTKKPVNSYVAPTLDYFYSEMCENINKHAKNLEFVTISEHGAVLEGLTTEGSAKHRSQHAYESELRQDCDTHFCLSSEGGSYLQLKRLTMGNLWQGIDEPPMLSELGKSFRQLEYINVYIEVDFTEVNVPIGTVLFPNLIQCGSPLISASRTQCACTFAKRHMPRAKFYQGLDCIHCRLRNGHDIDSVDELISNHYREDFPTWEPG